MDALDPQNPDATRADPPFDEPSRRVSKPTGPYDPPQEPDEAVGESCFGLPADGENIVDVPYLDRTDDLDINDDLATITDWWTHIGWEGFGGWNYSHHKFVYPGSTVVPVYAEPVEQNLLYLKTKAYYDDAGYWRDGQNPMLEMLLDTRDLSEAEFAEAIITFTNAAYPYTRRYQKRRDRATDGEPDSTDKGWRKRTPADAA